ncbi:MAG: 16S rRNA (cytidine(1402)-2'-O)-methyltransferase [Candidatus Kerfeldbacteria bacterium]|nr:16S rRNA (cytidine(1402)-2'-O)-methyltransferase [Candidatus Kerfeldbacteria bacterium]
MPGTLFVVGTPIGNLEDLTIRARRILGEVGLIACEDTRTTRKLVDHYGITTKLVSLHHHSTERDIDGVLAYVAEGDVAIVTDAGMPGIADPGGKVVARAAALGLKVESVPGPAALTTAVALSGLPTDRFLFLGFLPHKKGRETLFRRIAATEETVILYESPHRLLKTLESLVKLTNSRQVVVARELTKVHESVIRGTALHVLKHFQDHLDQAKGEIVLVIGPR